MVAMNLMLRHDHLAIRVVEEIDAFVKDDSGDLIELSAPRLGSDR